MPILVNHSTSVPAVLATAEEEKCKYLSAAELRHAFDLFTLLLYQLMGHLGMRH